MKIYVDIDETISTNNIDRDYSKAKPIHKNIKRLIDYLIKVTKELMGPNAIAEPVLIGIMLQLYSLKNGV